MVGRYLYRYIPTIQALYKWEAITEVGNYDRYMPTFHILRVQATNNKTQVLLTAQSTLNANLKLNGQPSLLNRCPSNTMYAGILFYRMFQKKCPCLKHRVYNKPQGRLWNIIIMWNVISLPRQNRYKMGGKKLNNELMTDPSILPSILKVKLSISQTAFILSL